MSYLNQQLNAWARVRSKEEGKLAAERKSRIDACVFAELDKITRREKLSLAEAVFSNFRAGFFARKAIGIALFVFLILGGGFSASAAFGKLIPGEKLYGLKRAGERAQLTFAVSSSVRARLRTEFAGKRLEEAAELADRGSSAEAAIAVNEFTEELRAAEAHLSELQEKNGKGALRTARELERKAALYNVILEKTAIDNGLESGDEVSSAKEAIDNISIAAVQAILNEHEKGGQTVTGKEARAAVEQKMRELEAELQLTAVRLTSIPDLNYPEITALGGPTLRSLIDELTRGRRVFEGGRDFFARGAYNAALSEFRAVIGVLNHLEWAIRLYENAEPSLENGSAGEVGESAEENGFKLPILRE